MRKQIVSLIRSELNYPTDSTGFIEATVTMALHDKPLEQLGIDEYHNIAFQIGVTLWVNGFVQKEKATDLQFAIFNMLGDD